MKIDHNKILIKRIKQQRNHLGGHLKNVVVHLDDVHARILDECDRSRVNRNYSKKMLIRAIKGIVGYSHRWVEVPKSQALQFHPLNQYDNEDWWERKIEKDKYFITENKLDDIYPNQKEFNEYLEKVEKGVLKDIEC
tara:strand:- start:349 stop:759 length:411 start_codon:yes stop_codon:yes gene_type:complete